MEKVLERAFAKINLGLRVLPKRQDGFHNLEGIFQTIQLFDELEVMKSSDIGCKVFCKTVDLPEENTITLAYKAFLEVTEKKFSEYGVAVELKKGIPSGGGLGGGSSDAAAFIRALEKLYDVNLSLEQKDYIASKTGSDVFFFMHSDTEGRACSLVSGRGEIIKNIKPREDLYILLIFPEEGSSTKTAYALLDDYFANGNSVNCPEFSELETVYNRPVEKWTFKNSFTPVIMNSIKEVHDALGALFNNKCCYAEMSGSGSTVFGVFTLLQQAEEVEEKLAGKWNCKLVKVY